MSEISIEIKFTCGVCQSVLEVGTRRDGSHYVDPCEKCSEEHRKVLSDADKCKAEAARLFDSMTCGMSEQDLDDAFDWLKAYAPERLAPEDLAPCRACEADGFKYDKPHTCQQALAPKEVGL